MKKKVKRYQEGGVTINQQAAPMELPGLTGYGAATNTYPFQSSGSTPSTPSATGSGSGSGVNQTFNIQPSAQAGQPEQAMKRGGKVSSASKRADGCCIRGKTRA
jgi:hypothetical protein